MEVGERRSSCGDLSEEGWGGAHGCGGGTPGMAAPKRRTAVALAEMERGQGGEGHRSREKNQTHCPAHSGDG